MSNSLVSEENNPNFTSSKSICSKRGKLEKLSRYLSITYSGFTSNQSADLYNNTLKGLFCL